MNRPTCSFVFALCQVGAEAPLKAEVLRLHPTWRFAFSRPGLITWKTPSPVAPDIELGAVFARCHGLSLGRASSAADIERLLGETLPNEPFALHVFEREFSEPEVDVPEDAGAAAVQTALTGGPLGARLLGRGLKPGDLVVDVIVAPGEAALLGLHRHARDRSLAPGGRPALTLPEHAPSRAWLKLEEGLLFSQLPLRPGEVAVEVGSAPGGASLALLDRGLTVIGVDPGVMADAVLAHPAFTHLQVKLGDLRREALPPRVDWLLLDVNLAPAVALHQLRRIVSTLRASLRGGLFTLKLNDWKMAEKIPEFLQRLQAMGFTEVRATQLAHNRQEICVAARTDRRS